MNTVSFTLEDDALSESFGDVPITIRNAALEFVQRTRFGQAVALKEGYYVATARLPNGPDLECVFEVEPGAQSVPIALGPRASEAPERPDLETSVPVYRRTEDGLVVARHGFGGFRLRKAFPELVIAAVARPRIHLVRGNPFCADGSSLVQADLEISDTGIVRIPEMPEPPYYIVVISDEREPALVALPVSPRETAVLTLDQTPLGPVLDIRPTGMQAALQLGYLTGSLVDDARRTVRIEDILRFEESDQMASEMLRDKVTAPVAAAIGGYILLRMDALAELTVWVKNLAGWFTWLPDGAILYAELLARTGRHAEAIQWLMVAHRRGLPILAMSLRVALKRLTLYAGRLDKRGFADIDEAAFEAMYEQMALAAASLVEDQPLTALGQLSEAIHLPDPVAADVSQYYERLLVRHLVIADPLPEKTTRFAEALWASHPEIIEQIGAENIAITENAPSEDAPRSGRIKRVDLDFSARYPEGLSPDGLSNLKSVLVRIQEVAEDSGVSIDDQLPDILGGPGD